MIAPILTSGSDFFNPAQGGDSALFQHIIWFLGHPEFWLSIFVFLINIGVMFALSRHSHFGKGLSAIWLGAILYAASMKFRYFKTLEPLAAPQITLINIVHIGIILVAAIGCLWFAIRIMKQQKHRKGLSQR